MLTDQLESLRLTKVRPAPYAGTYAIIPAASMMAAQVANRDSASWKKAEHIFFDHEFPDRGKSLLAYWIAFSKTNPDGERSTQALYVPIGRDEYVKYDVRGKMVAKGKLEQMF